VELTQIPPGEQNRPPSVDQAPPQGESAKIALPVIKAGETLRCAAMFRGLDPQMDRLTIFVRGLTNDFEIEAAEPHRRKVRERVLELVYESPGDEFSTHVRPIRFVSEKWVDIEKVVKTDLDKP
jgi:hypothetical protein